jgi:hypothetical protein
MSVRTLNETDGWTVECDACHMRLLDGFVPFDNRESAVKSAALNGWILNPNVLCENCSERES